jgi:hypothetical protein
MGKVTTATLSLIQWATRERTHAAHAAQLSLLVGADIAADNATVQATTVCSMFFRVFSAPALSNNGLSVVAIPITVTLWGAE